MDLFKSKGMPIGDNFINEDKIETIIFELILKHIKDLIYVMSVDKGHKFRYVFLNNMAKRHAKLEEDCIGKTLQEVLPHDTAENLQKYYEQVLLTKQPVMFDDKVILANNQVVYGESLLTPIFNNDGEILLIVSITRDITESVYEKNMIKFMAYHDQLTGLSNRSSFKEELNQAVKLAERNGTSFALMYLDLDRFKFLNDTMGHLAGDILLKEVAKRLEGFQSNECYVFRQGGDEFTIILSNTSREAAMNYASEILTSLDPPFEINQKEIFITASIGISLFPQDGLDGETLIKNADTALYKAKELGKSQYQLYSKEMTKQNFYLHSLETGLRKAIEHNEFEIYFQPQVNIYTGEVNSFEALLRWEHSSLGTISPVEFIPLAEETGLITMLGEWVIKTVCRKVANWKENGFPLVSVAINLSSKQFHQTNLVEIIKDSIFSNRLDPGFFEFEITEGAMEDANKAIVTLTKLKALGVQIAIDDFGTGYSSLSHIKRFPIDTIKIDKSFIRDVTCNEKDAAITTTIIHLAQSLGLKVIAEGVEDEQQVEFLRKMRCHIAQGYYYSTPLPESVIIEKYLQKKQV